MPHPDLTPAQRRVLTVLAADGEIEAHWGTSTSYLFRAGGITGPSVSAATRDALVRLGYIRCLEHSYPQRWRITPAGRERAAQEGPPDAQR